MAINRTFTSDNFLRVNKDFRFLLKFIIKSKGEYDFSIRDNYFNIYYKGNSLAKVSISKSEYYRVSINEKFFRATKADNNKFYTAIKRKNIYANILLHKKELHPFFQVNHMNNFASKIKDVNNGEEIGFEQQIITSNLNREEYIIIDRQVTDSELKRKRMDLLLLKQVKEKNYQFLVGEVKMGNNPELSGDVATQLSDYVTHIDTNFPAYKDCYEIQYAQKRKLGLIIKPSFDKINIVKPVKGIVIVGGYAGKGKEQIADLKAKQQKIEVKELFSVL